MMPIRVVLGLALTLAAGCVAIAKDDKRPGGRVLTEDKAISWMPQSLSQRRKAGMQGWVYVQLHASAGASVCRVEGASNSQSPYRVATPDAQGVAMLAVKQERRRTTFACRDDRRVVTRRAIESEKVTYKTLRLYDSGGKSRSYWVVPPLAHMNPADPNASAHWTAMIAELCVPARGDWITSCKEHRLEHMQARDTGRSVAG